MKLSKTIPYLHLTLALCFFAGLNLAQAIQAQPYSSLKLHSVGLAVTDLDRSLTFYQELLGLPQFGKSEDTVYLRLGSGSHYLSLTPAAADDTPRITSIGLSAINFDADAFAKQLQNQGFKQGAPTAVTNATRLNRANTYWIADGVLHFVDLEGVEIQITNASYCGSSTFDCDTVDHPKGKLSLLGINHFTTFMSNAPRANEFYMGLLGLGIQSYQGPTTPAIAVGDGLQFLMFVGPAREGAPQNPATMHHVSFIVADFDVDKIFATLKEYGLTARPDGVNPAPPLTYYVSLRMPNRGGAEGGTPELYFTDPDGILLQVQDPSYCGGGGYLGDKC